MQIFDELILQDTPKGKYPKEIVSYKFKPEFLELYDFEQ